MKPTPTMRKALENAVAGRRLSYGMPGGRSFAGGFSGTLLAMRQRGWLDAGGNITAAGREAIGASRE